MGMRRADTNNIVHIIQKREAHDNTKTCQSVCLVDPHHQEDTALHRSGSVLSSTSILSSVGLCSAHVHQQCAIVEGAVERWGDRHTLACAPGTCTLACKLYRYSIAYNIIHRSVNFLNEGLLMFDWYYVSHMKLRVGTSIID